MPWRVSFNKGKSKSTLIIRCRGVLNPVVYFGGKPLKFETHPKSLGVILERQLTWRPHLERTHSRAVQRQELLLRVTSESAGARHDRVVLLFKVCVRPLLEYVCCVWNDAAPTLKSRLIDSIQHRVLARAMGVRRSTSSEALEVETGVEPLSLRRCFLTARVYLRYLTAKTRTGRLIRAHRDGNLTVFRSRFYSSFSLRGENLVCVDGDFPKDSNFLGRMVISWESKWRASARGRWFFYLHPKVSMVPGKWASGFPRWVVSTLAGMRLGNTILKDDLHRCRLESSPLCRCGEPETRGHFWLRCLRRERLSRLISIEF